MYPLTADQLLYLIGQHRDFAPVIPALEDAVAQRADPRMLLALAEILTGYDPKILMLTTRYEIGAGALTRVALDPGVSSADELRALIDEYCIFGFFRGSACFCPFSFSDHEAMKKDWRALVARLEVAPTDPSALRPLFMSSPVRTVAALTSGKVDGGRRVAHFHHHPGLDAKTAAGFLRECIRSTMPEAEA